MTHRFQLPVYPHDTDYGGIVSHRAIVTWLEMARIDFVRSVGLEFAELWTAGFDLPVVELQVRYLKMIPFGVQVSILTRLVQFQAPRLSWTYALYSPDEQLHYAQARSDHAIVDRGGRPCRRFPAVLTPMGPLIEQDGGANQTQ
ncbi:thioesterase family protein [Candidatus Cyanaurora vandensis]|uniref:acyl-CoA thioesterase n=1 Tax=Candidatus Cyanaurora vandensis TaxID=2714958 RepID=UPI0025801C8F|nr:acyl-CoA thioesterase [Candidatus Cyanaurora vandensis]